MCLIFFLIISYLLWRINISSFCFYSSEIKLFLKFNSNTYRTTYHLNDTMNYCMISEKHWHKKWNQCYIRDMKHIFSNSESSFEIHQDGSIYIHLWGTNWWLGKVFCRDLWRCIDKNVLSFIKQTGLDQEGMVNGWQDGNIFKLQKVLNKFRFCKGALSLKTNIPKSFHNDDIFL